MTEIITPEEMRQEQEIRASVSVMERPQLEEAFLHLVSTNVAAGARVEALENDLQLHRDLLERERTVNAQAKRGKNARKKLLKGEQIYELVSAFDATKITPLPGRSFLMGHIDDVIVIEIPSKSTSAEVAAFREGIQKMGITSACMLVKEGTKFLKLRVVDPKTREEIERHLHEQSQAQAEAARSETTGVSGEGAEHEAAEAAAT